MKHKDLYGSALGLNPWTEFNKKFHLENRRLQNGKIAPEKRIYKMAK